MTTQFMTPEVLELALNLTEKLNCPRSVSVAILIRSEEWLQLLELQCKPSDYSSAEDYLRATAATDFLRKVEAVIPGIDPGPTTFQKWEWAEKECFKTNCRLNEIMDFGTLNGDPVPDAINRFIERFRDNVRSLIGSGPGAYEQHGRFGPGATVSDNYGRTTVPHKMSSTPTFTPSALFHLVPWTGTRWASACAARGDVPVEVRGNSYFTVPKTALTYRSCAKESSINAFFQLGLGHVMRKRLMRSGIDLDHGQNVHRQVACSSSITGEFCTLDLSSASDTICQALVKLVMPEAWFTALSSLRSTVTIFRDGKKKYGYRLEKFSSMGNGFTFELETVIFTALCMSCSEELIPGWNLLVYGDDLIVPTGHHENVISALKFFGFTLNARKSFVEGPFRESCGGDFYDGQPVRAYFLKEFPNEPQHFIAIANGLRRLALSFGQDSRLWADLRGVWFRCLDYLPSSIRACRGPEQLGDLCIHDHETRWSTRSRANCIRYVRVFRPCAPRGVSFNRFCPDVQIAAALYGIRLAGEINDRWPDGFDNRQLIDRDPVMSYKVGWLPFS